MNWFRKFMLGRYGSDQLSIALIVLALILSISSRIFKLQLLSILYLLTIGVTLYRIFSKDIPKRYQENLVFLKKWNPIKKKVRTRFKRIKNFRSYKHFKCPGCQQTLSVPRGKGKIAATCPKCRTVVIKKS